MHSYPGFHLFVYPDSHIFLIASDILFAHCLTSYLTLTMILIHVLDLSTLILIGFLNCIRLQTTHMQYP